MQRKHVTKDFRKNIFMTTINQFLIAKLSTGQEVWFVITKHVKPYLFWWKYLVTLRKINIAIREGITNIF